MTNNHCDYVSIELAWDLMRKLKLKKGKFARMCEVSTQQLRNWEKKGRMPAIRFAAVENALKKAEIEDFKWHDLRHSAASYLAMNGASLAEIAAVLGHKTLSMVKRYSHLSDSRHLGN